jgi:23S rRNA (cytosine1962-C5)-methyltransferase
MRNAVGRERVLASRAMLSGRPHDWPPGVALRVLHEDAALLVVTKPSGVSTQATEHAGDDMIARVRAVRSEPYLGVVQRLERDASGVQLFTREKRWNASLAPQFERNTARRTFVIGLDGVHETRREGSIVSWLAPRGEGMFDLVKRGSPRARRAEVRWRIDTRERARALVAVDVIEGSLATARAQIASLGSLPTSARDIPDPLAWPLVHLHRLEIEHPVSHSRVTYTAPLPTRFENWLRAKEADASTWRERVLDAAAHRFALARDATLDAYRLANDVGDETPGITVDRYGEYALVQFYSAEAESHRDVVLDAIASLGARGVYAKFRPKQANTLVDTRREHLAPAHALRGEDTPDPFTIVENGLHYRVRLGDGLSTGIFLDQRANRALVRSLARDARVLNLFAYTCPFTVAATAGGALGTVSVDVSSRALEQGRANLERNGLGDPSRHLFASADVFGWIDGARARGDSFDLVILDPPSYSTTKDGSRFSSESDYRDLAARALGLVAPSGRLLACSNHRGIRSAKFTRIVTQAVADARRVARAVRELPAPPDFPPPPGGESHLKSVLVELA